MGLMIITALTIYVETKPLVSRVRKRITKKRCDIVSHREHSIKYFTLCQCVINLININNNSLYTITFCYALLLSSFILLYMRVKNFKESKKHKSTFKAFLFAKILISNIDRSADDASPFHLYHYLTYRC